MNNPPAFPARGMTLRDYFAAAAMQGILAANFDAGDVSAATDNAVVALHSYEIADAMLRQRAGDEQP